MDARIKPAHEEAGKREAEMAGRLQGKVALITAAGQGIGRAIAEAFVAEGAKVVATDVDAGKLKGLRGAAREKLDVRSTDSVETLAKEVGRKAGTVEVLVNCAGFEPAIPAMLRTVVWPASSVPTLQVTMPLPEL